MIIIIAPIYEPPSLYYKLYTISAMPPSHLCKLDVIIFYFMHDKVYCNLREVK